MNPAKSMFVVIALTVISCIGIGIIEFQTKFLRRTYDEVMFDSRNHYLSCKQLPTEADVMRVVEAHRDTIKEIEQIHPGFVGMEIDTSTCPGKGDILFWYGTHAERLLIERIIADDTFYGIPYRLQNR